MAIRDWKVVPHGLGPIGEPFYANRQYMSSFCAQENLAIMRATEKELSQYSADRNSCIYILAIEEFGRRAVLDK